jgi:hypothetical protein
MFRFDLLTLNRHLNSDDREMRENALYDIYRTDWTTCDTSQCSHIFSFLEQRRDKETDEGLQGLLANTRTWVLHGMKVHEAKVNRQIAEALPERATVIMRALAAFIRQHGYSPTVRELASAVDRPRSHSMIQGDLNKLVAGGFVGRKEGAARTLHLTPIGHAVLDE